MMVLWFFSMNIAFLGVAVEKNKKGFTSLANSQPMVDDGSG
jgi:hypothetical protein